MSMTKGRKAAWSQTWRDIASPELTAALAEIGTPRRLSNGQLLYERGEPGRELYGVTSGLVRIVVLAEAGGESLLGLYTPGTWFGEVSLFDDLPRPVSAYAVGETEVLVVSTAKLREVLERNPIWYRDFAAVLCNKLRLTLGHIESSLLPVAVRLVLRLLDLSQAYGKPGATGLVIDLRLPQEELARMLGLTRQTVNKELRLLEERGWLRIARGEITLLDVGALQRLVREGGGEALLND